MSSTDIRPDRATLFVVGGTDMAEARARFRLVGDFALFAPTGDRVAIANRRGRALLAYLYLAPEHSASREQLAALLWSDRGETQARANLRKVLGDLRETLSRASLDFLDVGRHRITLRADGVTSDLVEIEGSLAGGDSGAATLVLANSRSLLDDLEIGGLFEEWLSQTRTRLEQTIASSVHSHLDRLEGAGRWRDVGPVADAFLHRDPLDESVVAAAIRADTATGNIAVAHRRYRILHAALSRELGVAPGPVARDALARTAPQPPDPMPSRDIARSDTESFPTTQMGPPLVVVSAFETSGSWEGVGRLGAVLREEIVSGLSRFRDLRVITDPRSMNAVSADAAARRSGDYLLGASLHGLESEARLNVHLLRLDNRQVIWSSQLSAAGSRMVEIIDGTIAKTVGAVLPTINADLLKGASNLPANSAYHRYLASREAALSASTYEMACTAVAMLEATISEFPTFSLPYLPLAALYNTDFGYTRAGSSGADERSRALELAKRALSLDRAHANAYTATGWSYLWLNMPSAARGHFEQALALNPFHASRVMEAGFGMLFLGEIETARTLLNRCLLLNPAPEDGFFSDLGLLEYLDGNHNLASGYFSLVANPSVWASLYTALNADASGAHDARAIEAAHRRISRIWPIDIPITIERLMDWIENHHPFQITKMKDRFLVPMRSMLLRSWQFA